MEESHVNLIRSDSGDDVFLTEEEQVSSLMIKIQTPMKILMTIDWVLKMKSWRCTNSMILGAREV